MRACFRVRLLRVRLIAMIVSGLVGLIAGSGLAAAQGAWDAAGSEDLSTWLRQGIDAANGGDFSFMRATSDAAVGYDLDAEGNPAAFYGAAEVNGFVDSFAQMIADGGSVHIAITRLDCHAVSGLGYCTMESDQTFGMGGETMGPFHFRSTIVAAKPEATWVITHFHGSLAEFPEMGDTEAAPETP